MKKIALFSVMLISSIIYSQDKIKLENLDGQVQATYYYDNGNVRQIGNFVDGKLDGKWISYTESGKVETIGIYKNGKRHGKWLHFDNNAAVKKVSYSNNIPLEIITTNKNPLVYAD